MSKPYQSEKHLAELMSRVQLGNSEAYRELLENITPRLRRIVRRQRSFLQTDDIEDLVQDILLSLHAVRATYDPARPSYRGFSLLLGIEWPMAPDRIHARGLTKSTWATWP